MQISHSRYNIKRSTLDSIIDLCASQLEFMFKIVQRINLKTTRSLPRSRSINVTVLHHPTHHVFLRFQLEVTFRRDRFVIFNASWVISTVVA